MELKCQSCGFNNDDNNKFCSNCGSELHSFEGKTAKAKPKLYLDKKMNKRNINSLKNNSLNLKLLWISVGIVITSILIAISFDLISHKYPNSRELTVERKSSSLAIETQVTAIASKFACSCLTNECNYTSLESCTCGTASEERQFITTKIEKNVKPDDIVVELADKYGFLKSEFVSKYKVSPSKVWNSNK
ncbi:MAG: zinc-ribbon domain-containing protein [Ignavibacteriaceae bacterium]